MAFRKFAALEADILGVKGSSSHRTATLDKFADFDEYRTEDGYLYARIRAISSRVNKNNDGWPSVELAGSKDIFDRHTAAEGGFTVEASKDAKYGFSTFLGKPHFVDHHNSDPDRARGVIVDAKLHVEDHRTATELDPYYSSAPSEHLPPTWVELLLEVDAKSFPKLAKAIIEGSENPNKGIDGFSMGCDVERSVCSICKNSAVSPDEFCEHVRHKGAEFDYRDPETGHRTSRKAYEDCYGIHFFEISSVFDPADETALLREVRSSKEAQQGEAWDERNQRGFGVQPYDTTYGLDMTDGPKEQRVLQTCPTCEGFADKYSPHGCPTCGDAGEVQSTPVPHPGAGDGAFAPHHVNQTPMAGDRIQGIPVIDPATALPDARKRQGNSQQGKMKIPYRVSKAFKQAMTAKDFVLLADAIRTCQTPDRVAVAEHFANYLSTTNPAFDKERFLAAAIGEPMTGRDNYKPPEGMSQPEPGHLPDNQPGDTTLPGHWGKQAADNVARQCPSCDSHTTGVLDADGNSRCHACGNAFKTPVVPANPAQANTKTADNPLPQSEMLHAPEDIDTLRKEMVCPICGSTMDSEKCDLCGYIEPPDNFNNPDLNKAQDTDLHQEEGPNGDDTQVSSPEFSPAGPENTQATAHVKDDMASWQINVHPKVAGRINTNEEPIKGGEATDEPNETVVSDQTAPVTSRVRTASDFIKAAGRNKENTMERTADAASGAPAVATPDVNVDADGVGGVMDGSNEEASKADAQIDVEGEGGTGVESVSAESTESVEGGDEHSKNIESIPTKTFDDGSSAVERQADPVGGDVFPASAEGVRASREASDPEAFPKDDGGLAGGSAEKGTQPADPVGVAEDRVNVLETVTSPENNSGPTETWSGTDGNGVTRQQDPVTNETIEGEDIVNLSPKGSSHVITAFKLADLEVELGLLDVSRKYARIAELEAQSPEQLQTALAYAQKVRTAGLSKGVAKTAKKLPVLGRNSSVTKETSEEADPFGDSALFG